MLEEGWENVVDCMGKAEITRQNFCQLAKPHAKLKWIWPTQCLKAPGFYDSSGFSVEETLFPNNEMGLKYAVARCSANI